MPTRVSLPSRPLLAELALLVGICIAAGASLLLLFGAFGP